MKATSKPNGSNFFSDGAVSHNEKVISKREVKKWSTVSKVNSLKVLQNNGLVMKPQENAFHRVIIIHLDCMFIIVLSLHDRVINRYSEEPITLEQRPQTGFFRRNNVG